MKFGRLFGMMALLLALVSVTVAPQRAAAQESDAAVTPPVGGPGTEFAFFATGFDDDERVGLWLNDPNNSVVRIDQEVDANNDGRADWTWSSPANAQPGIWQMVAQGIDSDVMQVIPFEISASAPVSGTPGETITDAEFGVNPTVGAPDTTFDFFATGFDSEENVGYWLNAPDGSVVSTESEVGANDDGRADWSWTAPSDAQLGVWQMVARGIDSGREQVITFEIR